MHSTTILTMLAVSNIVLAAPFTLTERKSNPGICGLDYYDPKSWSESKADTYLEDWIRENGESNYLYAAQTSQ